MMRKIERVDAGIGSERRQKGRKIKEVVEASWATRVTCHREPVEQDYSNTLSSLHCTVEEDLASAAATNNNKQSATLLQILFNCLRKSNSATAAWTMLRTGRRVLPWDRPGLQGLGTKWCRTILRTGRWEGGAHQKTGLDQDQLT